MNSNKNKSISLQIDQQSIVLRINKDEEIIQKKATILFDKNEIEIGKEIKENNNNSISILSMKETEQITINYNQKQYKLTQSELLAIYLNLIIDEIEKKWKENNEKI